MKKFFNEYGGIAIIVIVIAVLLLLVGSVKSLDEATGKVNGSGIASMVGNKLSGSIGKFKTSFDNILSCSSESSNSPAGPVVSKTDSQVGKYADIDGDGTVDGIIFADLMVGGSGTWNDYNTANTTYNDRGTYTIPTISSCKDYYVSQDAYTNVLGGTAEVLSPADSGNSRFYIVALNDIHSNSHDWYNAAYSKGMNDFASSTIQNFGKGKSNTATMVNKWNSESYGNKNACSKHTDMWGEIQTQVNNGWFVPSRQELAAFAGQLGITKSNYSSKGLSGWYWSSSQSDAYSAYILNLTFGYVHDKNVTHNSAVRLVTTF